MHMGSPSKGCGLPLQDCSLSESRLGFTEGCWVSDRDNPADPHIANPKSETLQQVQQGEHMEINSASLVIRKMHSELHVTPTPPEPSHFQGGQYPGLARTWRNGTHTRCCGNGHRFGHFARQLSTARHSSLYLSPRNPTPAT